MVNLSALRAFFRSPVRGDFLRVLGWVVCAVFVLHAGMVAFELSRIVGLLQVVRQDGPGIEQVEISSPCLFGSGNYSGLRMTKLNDFQGGSDLVAFNEMKSSDKGPVLVVSDLLGVYSNFLIFAAFMGLVLWGPRNRVILFMACLVGFGVLFYGIGLVVMDGFKLAAFYL